MSDDNSLNRNIPFCQRSWKIPAVMLGLACLATFAWGFHVLKDYAMEEQRADSYGASVMSSLQAVGVGANAGNRLNAFNRASVVNVAGYLSGNGGQPAGQFASVGTGVIVNPTGYIVTALHIISNLDNIVVRAKTPTGTQSYDAEIVKVVPTHDLAMIKLITRDMFPFVTLGNSQTLQVGQQVYAFGDPQGTDLIVKEGVIRSMGQSVSIEEFAFTNLIQSDAVYQWAQAGGPLIDSQSRMLGLNIAVVNPNGQTTGYAIPSHVIVAHFQDVTQFLTSMTEINATVAAPPTQNPATRNKTQETTAEPWETEIGRNATARIPASGTVGTNGVKAGQNRRRLADTWWDKARAFLKLQTGAAAMSSGSLGVNAAAFSTTKTLKDTSHAPGWTLWGYSLEAVEGLLLLGFLSGISGGMMTMGGGIIKVTGLMLFFGYGILLVRPVAYITNIFIYGSASMRYNKDGLITWGTVRPLIPWAMAGVVIGYFVGNNLDIQTIYYLLGAFALWVAVKILIEIYEAGGETGEGADSFAGLPDRESARVNRTIWRRLFGGSGAEGRGGYIERDMAQDGILGLPMGIISGILGISGGVVEVPLQRYVANAPLKNAIANSAILVFCASVVGSLVAMIHGVSIGAFDWDTPLTLAVIIIPGAYVGGMVGAWLTKVIPINVLRWVYATLMFAIAVRMFLS